MHFLAVLGKDMMLGWSVPGLPKRCSKCYPPQSTLGHGGVFRDIFDYLTPGSRSRIYFSKIYHLDWDNVCISKPSWLWSKDPAYREILAVIKHCCCANDRYWRTIYQHGVWIPRNVACQVVSDGWAFTDAYL